MKKQKNSGIPEGTRKDLAAAKADEKPSRAGVTAGKKRDWNKNWNKSGNRSKYGFYTD